MTTKKITLNELRSLIKDIIIESKIEEFENPFASTPEKFIEGNAMRLKKDLDAIQKLFRKLTNYSPGVAKRFVRALGEGNFDQAFNVKSYTSLLNKETLT